MKPYKSLMMMKEEEHVSTKIVANKIYNVDFNEQIIYQQDLILGDQDTTIF